MDLFIGAGGLVAELIAGEIQNLKPLALIFVIKLLKLRVLRGEYAFGGGVDNQQNPSFVVSQRNLPALLILHRKIINSYVR